MAKDEHPSRELSRRLSTAIFAPLLLLVASGALLGLQLMRMADDQHWVDHTDEVLSVTLDMERQMTTQESALRAFLLTDDRSYLSGFTDNHPLVLAETARGLTFDNPRQIARINTLVPEYQAWLLLAKVALANPAAAAHDVGQSAERNGRMEALRATLNAMVDEEHELRRTRALAADSSATTTKILFVLLFLGLGAVLAFMSRRQLAGVGEAFEKALRSEKVIRVTLEEQDWVRGGLIKLSAEVQGDLTIEQLGERTLAAIAPYVGAEVGAVFTGEAAGWRRRAAWGLDGATAGPDSFARGEGLVGRAGEGKAIVRVREVPPGFLHLRSGTGETAPIEVTLVPAFTEGNVHAVIELGFVRAPGARELELLGRIGEPLALAVRSNEYKARLRELLEESQRQAEELQTQQEELRVANEELEEQGTALRATHVQLEERKEELESINTHLEEQASDLRQLQQAVTDKAAEAERASRYKSEFLANMSHELRTPLNSSLILAKLLGDNKEGNLTPEQVRFAQTIYGAGNDLLVLINDVLDLSKIEAGKVEVRPAPVSLTRLCERLTRMFEPLARERKIDFGVTLVPGAPTTVETDGHRLEQILKNLLSNALKFTPKGSVSLRISVDPADPGNLRFAVEDSGIGIAGDKQEVIFEAFQQADGTTGRRFGGTGLGLAISRDLSILLGGQLTVTSEKGKGSVFTLILPRERDWNTGVTPMSEELTGPIDVGLPPGRAPAGQASTTAAEPPRAPDVKRGDGKSAVVQAIPVPVSTAPTPPRRRVPVRIVPDDRDEIDRRRRLVLVIEDDPVFAQILVDLAHELDFQAIVGNQAEDGVSLARAHNPTAIVLDLNLPDHSGLSVLDRLKRSPATRHIPVHMVSVEDKSQEALAMGAVGYLLKPVGRDQLATTLRALEARATREMRRLLIVEDDPGQREGLTQLLGGGGVETVAVGTAAAALDALAGSTFDCIVTDLTLPDASGFEVLEKMSSQEGRGFAPVIVYTARSLTPAEEQRLRRYSTSVILKGVRSPERLLDEVTLFLHQVDSELSPERRRMLAQARDREAIFAGRRILVVEDDARNIFALSSVLEPKGAKVLIARNGREALDVLDEREDVDLVLMDIMMPEMDGVTATREIRKQAKWAKLPIIALTAKAMQDDQQRCREAGANDYITKPLDVEMLLSLLRVWMPKS